MLDIPHSEKYKNKSLNFLFELCSCECFSLPLYLDFCSCEYFILYTIMFCLNIFHSFLFVVGADAVH